MRSVIAGRTLPGPQCKCIECSASLTATVAVAGANTEPQKQPRISTLTRRLFNLTSRQLNPMEKLLKRTVQEKYLSLPMIIFPRLEVGQGTIGRNCDIQGLLPVLPVSITFRLASFSPSASTLLFSSLQKHHIAWLE